MSSRPGQEHATAYSDKAGADDTQSELAGTLQDITSELSSDVKSNGRAELANPERLLINSPKGSNTSPTKTDFAESTSVGYNGSVMGANLNTATDSQGTSSAGARRAHPHVMSWMDYNGDAGPHQ